VNVCVFDLCLYKSNSQQQQKKKRKKEKQLKHGGSSKGRCIKFCQVSTLTPGILFDFLLIQQGCRFLLKVVWHELLLGVRGQYSIIE